MVELVRGRSGSADPRKDVQEAMREKKKTLFYKKNTHRGTSSRSTYFFSKLGFGYATPAYLGEKGLGWTMT